jgi:hypothetical protein
MNKFTIFLSGIVIRVCIVSLVVTGFNIFPLILLLMCAITASIAMAAEDSHNQ